MAPIPTRLRRASLERMHLPRFARHAERTPSMPRQRHWLRGIRAARRILWVALFTPPACLIQAVLLAAGSPLWVRFGAFYWGAVAHAIGLEIRTIGHRAAGNGPRPVIYVSNHSSWLDIPALGHILRAPFVAKGEVATWPVVSLIARLGRTVFVTRNRAGIAGERAQLEARLEAGESFVLFPEGTSSDGSRVLPFNSSFLAAAFGEARPLVQPVSVVYDRLAGLPVGHASRAVFSWYGDMSLAPHAWQVAQWRGKRVTILLHAPLDPADFPDRKALARACWQAVAEGAAALRQNRPARPLPQSPAGLRAAGEGPAFA